MARKHRDRQLADEDSVPTRPDGHRRAADEPPQSVSVATGRWLALQHEEEKTDLGQGAPFGARYRDLGLIGRGGMGEVRRILDRGLNRAIAVKLLRWKDPDIEMLTRFVAEAQVTAQLQHPGIIPVHELGRLDDGRLYFTMREVGGRTLRDVIRASHKRARGVEGGEAGVPLRRLVAYFQRACEAVAYAHNRGVVHRDIKPSNIMVGDFGEVLLLDWGIAKVLGQPEPVRRSAAPGTLIKTQRDGLGDDTEIGSLMGTLAYMPPEQASGQHDLIDVTADVYALGATLFEILACSPPIERGTEDEMTLRVLDSEFVPLRGPWPIPDTLRAICEQALQGDPGRRQRDASELVDAIGRWLDGEERRERAQELMDKARSIAPRVVELRERAQALRVEAAVTLAALPPLAPESDKAQAWALEDEAETLEQEAALRDLEVDEGLRAALSQASELHEARAELARRCLERHRAAEARGDTWAATREAARLEGHATLLPPGHPVKVRATSWLKGVGALSLATDPPGAEVILHPYLRQHRRLVPGPPRSLGRSPLYAETLPIGSYLAVLRAPGRAEVRYPIRLERGRHWDGVGPEERLASPIPLPRIEDLGPDDLYVPPGWFVSGGDPQAPRGLPAGRAWVPGFVIRRFPVTQGEYLAFINALLEAGRTEELRRALPRSPGDHEGGLGRATFEQAPDGSYRVPDAQARLPVARVDWHAAMAYARWEGERTGRRWTLPTEAGWEKAARGVDGRFFPWGDHFDPTWCCVADSLGGRHSPMDVDTHPVDESPYGVRGLAGGIREWCGEMYEARAEPPAGRTAAVPAVLPEGPGWRSLRGGAWGLVSEAARVAGRAGARPEERLDVLGFRLARSL